MDDREPLSLEAIDKAIDKSPNPFPILLAAGRMVRQAGVHAEAERSTQQRLNG